MKHHWYSNLPHERNIEPYSGPKVCSNCSQTYHTEITMQKYHREVDYDMCPYCGACNHVSTLIQFVNTKM